MPCRPEPCAHALFRTSYTRSSLRAVSATRSRSLTVRTRICCVSIVATPKRYCSTCVFADGDFALAVAQRLDNRRQFQFGVFQAGHAAAQRRCAEGQHLGQLHVARERDGVEHADDPVRLIAAVDLERVAGLGVGRRGNPLLQQVPYPRVLEVGAQAAGQGLRVRSAPAVPGACAVRRRAASAAPGPAAAFSARHAFGAVIWT